VTLIVYYSFCKQLMVMVKEGLGRYPKWYKKELDEKK
jgi:hypothetical protein